MANVSQGSLGIFGWAMQTAKDTIVEDDALFHWDRAQRVDFALNQIIENLPDVLGGKLVPQGSFKGGAFSGGTFRTNPALADENAAGEKGIGAIFKALAGGAAYFTGTGEGYNGTGVHAFPGAPDDFNLEKYWLTVRRMIPGSNYNLGETYGNVLVASLAMEATPGQPLVMDVAFQGGATQAATKEERLGILVDMEEDPDWVPEYNPFGSIPLTINGAFELPWGEEVDTASRVQINIANNLTDPRSMMVIGRVSPVDYARLSRRITVSWTHMWEDGDLVRQIVSNDVDGNVFSEELFTSSFGAWFSSPDGDYTLGFYAPVVSWQAAPVQLVAGNLVAMEMNGSVLDAGAGADWMLWMKNDKVTLYG
jgi:hypothetical protein